MKVVVTRGQFGFTLADSRHCCGLQEIGGFFFDIPVPYDVAEVEVSAEEKERIRNHLSEVACTYATTLNDRGDCPSQYAAALVLEQVGFELVNEFNGNSGNPLKMWVYNRREE